MLQSFIRSANKKKIEIVANATGALANATSVTINKPTGTSEGDLLVAFFTTLNGGAWSGDTGWTEVLDQAGSGGKGGIRIAYKVAGSSEGSSYTFTTTKDYGYGAIISIRNAAWDTVGTLASGLSGSTQTANSITIGKSDAFLFAVFATTRQTTNWSSPSSGLVSYLTGAASSYPSYAIYYDDFVASGSTGTKSATISGTAGDPTCVLFSVKPA